MSPSLLDFSAYVAERTRHFTGRRWLFQRLEGWLADPDAPRLFLITGEPGSGKSTLCARLDEFASERALLLTSGEALTPASFRARHFCFAGDFLWLDPREFARSISLQLADRLPGFAEALVETSQDQPIHIEVHQQVGDAAGGQVSAITIHNLVVSGLSALEQFQRLVRVPLERLNQEGVLPPVVIVVDALDESARAGPDNIAALLANAAALPDAVRLILTSHPDPAILAPLRRHHPLQELSLTGPQAPAEVLEDVEQYVARRLQMDDTLAALTGPELGAADVVRAIRERSEGNFLYVVYLLESLAGRTEPLRAADLDRLPGRLHDLYAAALDGLVRSRDEWRGGYAPLLGTLAVARAPLTAAAVARLSGLDVSDVAWLLEPLRLYLDADDALPPAERTYRLYHQSFARYLLDPGTAGKYAIDGAAQHARIVGVLRDGHEAPGTLTEPYALRHLAHHTRRATPDDPQPLFDLLTPGFRQAQRVALGSDQPFRDALAEAIEAAQTLPPAAALPPLIRFALIDATLVSLSLALPDDALRDLARHGQSGRALALARLSTGERGRGEAAVAEGLRLAGQVREAARVAEALPAAARTERAATLGAVAGALAPTDAGEAARLLALAHAAAAAIPEPDSRARALAEVARRQGMLRPVTPADFEPALEAVRGMEEDAGDALQDNIMASNMMVQSVIEARDMMGRTPIDSTGAKARALADVAAAMARAGLDEAEEIFAEAEALAATIGGGPLSPLFDAHSQEYIAARRTPTPEPPPPTLPTLAEIERRLAAAARPPDDRPGFFAHALITLAGALAAAGERERAGELLARATTEAAAADAGYQAKWLADAAGLYRDLGDLPAAERLAARAAEVALEEADLMTNYSEWLAARGRTEVTSLREIAGMRGGFMKRRSYSDKALAQMVQSLASSDLEGAAELAQSIDDPFQRAVAEAALAGHAARAGQTGEAHLQQILEADGGALPSDEVLVVSAETVAPLHPPFARRLAEAVRAPQARVAALAAAAIHDPSLWSVVEQAAPAAGGGALVGSSFLALAAHRAAENGSDLLPLLERARAAIESDPSAVARLEGQVALARAHHDLGAEGAAAILAAAEEAAAALSAGRARGRVLARIAAAWGAVEPAQALRLLAAVRHEYRDSLLDAVAELVPRIADLGGGSLLAEVAAALEAGWDFFVTPPGDGG